MNINVNAHSSIKIDHIYFDPYHIDEATHDAKYIFITHTHYDHLSLEDIDKVINANTVLIVPRDGETTLAEKYPNKIICVKPNESLSLSNVEVETLPAYNRNKEFHKKSNKWVGYKIIYNKSTFAILGDTDNIKELRNISTDYLFVPIGGTYTMNATEAASLTNLIHPKTVIPVHYNLIVGTKDDEQTFLSLVDSSIKTKIYL